MSSISKKSLAESLRNPNYPDLGTDYDRACTMLFETVYDSDNPKEIIERIAVFFNTLANAIEKSEDEK